MTKQFAKPVIGKVVTATIAFDSYLKTFSSNVPKSNTYTGTVVRSASYDDPNSFRLTTGDPVFPTRIIPLDRVVSLIDANGQVGKTETKKKIEVTAWEVKSDSRKGGSYTVTREGNHFSCDCAGFMFRKNCRHVNKIKAEVA